MSFLVAAALALGLLVAAPIAAHLLRRGRAKEQEFPPAHLVPVAYRSARKRSRLEDRWLLFVRSLLVLLLAVVGAVPFVRCSRLALDRDAGASVALALVIDDSLSMRTRMETGDTRWNAALKGARDVLESTREGDAVGIVLAGKPARLALAATTDLGVVKKTLAELKPEDRDTDLKSAVRLANAALKALPHVDKRVAVLSDFATEATSFADVELWTPLPELRKKSSNCGIVRANLEGKSVIVELGCTGADAASGRKLRLVTGNGTGPNPGGKELATTELKAMAGPQQIELTLPDGASVIDAFLSGKDALEQDDYAPVAQAESAMLIGVVADPSTAAPEEGMATVIEQALGALTAVDSLGKGRPGEVRPLPLLPEDSKELEGYAAFIVDDPPGLAPESRSALTSWLMSGGYAAAFLGPNVQNAQLGASFEPFARGSLAWEATSATGIVNGGAFLGDAGESLRDLAPRGRLLLTGALIPGAEVVLNWSDQAPWMLRRRVGRGQAWTFGLPVSVDQSDLAVRPAFLALLERFVHDAAQTNGQRVSEAGTTWRLSPATDTVEGPEGKLEPVVVTAEADSAASERQLSPALRGRYRVTDRSGDFHERVVTVPEREIVSQPRSFEGSHAPKAAVGGPPSVEVSREFGLLLLLVVAVELLLRWLSRLRLHKQNPA